LKKAFANFNNILGFNLPLPDIAIEFEDALKRMEGGMVEITDGEVRFSNPGVREFIIGRILNDRHSVQVIETEPNLYSLEKWLHAPYSGANYADTGQALARRLMELLDKVTIDAKFVDVAVKLEEFIALAFGSDMLPSIFERYGNGIGNDATVYELYRILNWREVELEAANPSPHLEAVTKRIERDCDAFASGVKNIVIGNILDDVASFAEEIGRHSSATPKMKRVGQNMGQYAVTNYSSSWTPEDPSDVSTAIEHLETIGEVFQINVEDATYDLESEGPHEPDYDEDESRSIVTASDEISHGDIDEAEVISEMFQSLIS